MRISEYFNLGRTQAALDFIDVDVEGDTRAFVDPRAIKRIPGEWAQGCVGLLQDFFSQVLVAVRDDDWETGLRLLDGLREPNETHLGLSTARARGSGLGTGLSEEVWNELRRSEAAQSGLLQDLEETALVIRGINTDRISDITTNVIRQPLIDYTQDMAELYEIPLEHVGAGHTWDPDARAWQPEQYADLPVTPTGRLLLVPKAIVRVRLDFDAGEYYRRHILEALMERELAAGTALVHTLKSGRKRVYKKDVDSKYKREVGPDKRLNDELTREQPELLDHYRADKGKPEFRRPLLNLYQLSQITGADPPDWDRLLERVTSLPTGGDDAHAYHRAVESLLTALFYPSLVNPRIESELHQGRKRIDIRYTNSGAGGFFGWTQSNYPPQPYVFVECKNYSADLGNDALDQISGRFSAQRGKLGLLICRRFEDKPAFVARCRDTARDDRGFVLTVDDGDLEMLVAARKNEDGPELFRILEGRFGELVT